MTTILAPARNVTLLLAGGFVYLLVLFPVRGFSFQVKDNETCVLQGSVEDPSGRVVPGARISLEPVPVEPRRWRGGRGAPADRWVFTDERGFYCFSDIAPGLYRMRVTATGFEQKTFTSVIVKAGEKNVIDVVLWLAIKNEVITVTATATRTERFIESVPIRIKVSPSA
jgi:hypothetical protein